MGISDADRDRVNRMVRERTQKEATQRGDVTSSSSSGCLIVLACILLLAVTLGLMGA